MQLAFKLLTEFSSHCMCVTCYRCYFILHFKKAYPSAEECWGWAWSWTKSIEADRPELSFGGKELSVVDCKGLIILVVESIHLFIISLEIFLLNNVK